MVRVNGQRHDWGQVFGARVRVRIGFRIWGGLGNRVEVGFGVNLTLSTSFVGLLGTSAPLQRPAMAISRNFAPGVLL